LLLLFIYFLSKEGWEEGDMGREREKGERGDSTSAGGLRHTTVYSFWGFVEELSAINREKHGLLYNSSKSGR